MDMPANDEIEVSVFARGVGECIVVHCGDQRWLIVDSIKDKNGSAVAASYLNALGVDPDRVECIILTHWHEDHVRGATELATTFTKAKVALPAILMQDEFRAFLSAHGDVDAGEFGTGLTELVGVTKVLARQRDRVLFATANLPLVDSGGVRVDALSPSADDMVSFLREIQRAQGDPGGPDRRLTNPPRNDASVAVYIALGEYDRILLGADLEVSGKYSGWQFLHENTWNSRKAATLFKVPHHGSANAHYDPAWTDLLTQDRAVVLTPYGRGVKLPQETDVSRILALAPDAISASALNLPKGSREATSVERTLAEAAIDRVRPFTDAGHARFRKKIANGVWKHQLFQSACRLDALRAA